MEINVTQEHINRGRRNIAFCPVALAVNDLGLPCVVFHTSIRIKNKTFSLSKEVTTFIKAFDRGLPVEPFSFELGLENE